MPTRIRSRWALLRWPLIRLASLTSRKTDVRFTWIREPLIGALVHVDCLVTADAPNGLIRIGQQLAA